VTVAALSAVTGCSLGKSLVRGRVTLDDQPVAGAEVVFHAEGAGPRNVYGGRTDTDGRYELMYAEGTGGIAPGTYRVVITRQVDKGGAAPPDQDRTMRELGGLTRNTLPARYATPGQTPLRVEVKPGKNTCDFPLTAQAPAP
jgi:hypothetical protein